MNSHYLPEGRHNTVMVKILPGIIIVTLLIYNGHSKAIDSEEIKSIIVEKLDKIKDDSAGNYRTVKENDMPLEQKYMPKQEIRTRSVKNAKKSILVETNTQLKKRKGKRWESDTPYFDNAIRLPSDNGEDVQGRQGRQKVVKKKQMQGNNYIGYWDDAGRGMYDDYWDIF